MCARTLLRKAKIVRWRTAPSAFGLEVWDSCRRVRWRESIMTLRCSRKFG